MKTCCNCHCEKPLEEFHKRANASDGRRARCKECTNEYSRKYYFDNPARNMKYQDRKRDSGYDRQRWPKKRLQRHGISLDQFQEMFDSQNGCCAICGVESELTLRIDHDHSCCPGHYSCGKCIRGLLCHTCNAGLGQFRDDLGLVEAAAAYLRRS